LRTPLDPRATLKRRPLKLLERLLEISDTEAACALLGPQVGIRHPLPAYQAAAKELLHERAVARALRSGQPLLTEEQQRALSGATSRMLGLTPAGQLLTGASDTLLGELRGERDPKALVHRLDRFDPEGGWGQVPPVAMLTGLVMIAVSSESERRWKKKQKETAARIRGRIRARRDGSFVPASHPSSDSVHGNSSR